MKDRILSYAFKAFFGQSPEQIEEDARRRNARTRLREAHQLCLIHGITITPETDVLDREIRDEPAVQNYLHQLGLVHAVYNFPPQTSEPRYMLGYREGQR